jgi:uncharacterized membrane protein
MERFKNYGLWVGIGSFAVILAQTFGADIDFGQYENLYNAILSILVIAGIVNNPSLGTGYLDKTNKENKK